MNILYTITAYPPSIGGAQLHLHELVKRIQTRHSVGVIYQWESMRTDWLRGTTINAPTPAQFREIEGVPTYQFTLTPAQRSALERWVMTYSITQGTSIQRISSVMQAQIAAAMPYVLDAPPSLIHNSRIGREGLTAASLALAHSRGIPFVLTPNHHHHWKTWLHRHYLDIYRRADMLIAMTQVERDELIRLGVDQERITVLGISTILAETADPNRFRARHQIPPDAPLVLFVGQKYRYKRYTLLVEAMAEVWKTHPEAYLVLIGPRTRGSRRYFAKRSDLRLLELDQVDLQTKTDAIAACDVLCVPSAHESFGGVYLEAWTFGKPVIGGDAPAIREVIQDGVDGFIVGDSVPTLTERLRALLNDPAMRDAFGQAGQRKAAHYRWESLAAALADAYARLT